MGEKNYTEYQRELARAMCEAGPVSLSIFHIAYPDEKLKQEVNKRFQEHYINSDPLLKFQASNRERVINHFLSGNINEQRKQTI